MTDKINYKLGEICGELKGIKDDILELKNLQKEMQTDIKSFSAFKWRLSGIAAGVSGTVGIIIGLIFNYIKIK